MAKKNYMTFEEAKDFVKALGLKTQTEWKVYRKSGNKPSSLPASVDTVYKSSWVSWPDFFGTKKVAVSVTESTPTDETSCEMV